MLKEINIKATVANIIKVTEFINEELDLYNCPNEDKININIAIDEIITNIVKYAYNRSEVGEISVKVDVSDNQVDISFIDSGIPYNPVIQPDPDITLSAQDRKIGGLGIFLVKKLMDEVIYEYRDGKNILKIKKIFN